MSRRTARFLLMATALVGVGIAVLQTKPEQPVLTSTVAALSSVNRNGEPITSNNDQVMEATPPANAPVSVGYPTTSDYIPGSATNPGTPLFPVMPVNGTSNSPPGNIAANPPGQCTPGSSCSPGAGECASTCTPDGQCPKVSD